MSAVYNQKEVQAIVRSEMAKFSKEYLTQIEKSVHLFEKIETLEEHMIKLTDRVNKIQGSVSKCLPMIDNLENSVQIIKSSIESETSKAEYLKFIEHRVREHVLGLRAEILEEYKEKSAKNSEHKDPVKKLKEELKRLELIMKEGLARVEIKMNENDVDLRKLLFVQKSKIESKAAAVDKIYSQMSEGMSLKFEELVKLISDKFVLRTGFDAVKNEISSQMTGLTQTVSTLKNSIAQLQHLETETRTTIEKNQTMENYQARLISGTIESKLEKISHVGSLAR